MLSTHVKVKDIVYSSLSTLVPLLDSNVLQSLTQSLATKPQSNKVKNIIDKIRERLDQSNPVLGKRKRDGDVWKTAVVKLLEADIYNGPCGSQALDQMPDAGWVIRVLDTLKQRFSQ